MLTQLAGFDVLHWIRCLRPRQLIAVGQLNDADVWLARVLQVDPGKVEAVNQFIPHVAAVELAWHRGDSATASWHADEVGRYATRSGMPYIVVAALRCHGLAALVQHDFVAARNYFSDALKTARRSFAGREYEAKLLASLAEFCYRAGQTDCAMRTAAEAIETAHARTDRIRRVSRSHHRRNGNQNPWSPRMAARNHDFTS